MHRHASTVHAQNSLDMQETFPALIRIHCKEDGSSADMEWQRNPPMTKPMRLPLIHCPKVPFLEQMLPCRHRHSIWVHLVLRWTPFLVSAALNLGLPQIIRQWRAIICSGVERMKAINRSTTFQPRKYANNYFNAKQLYNWHISYCVRQE
jgi:hypothetical protein